MKKIRKTFLTMASLACLAALTGGVISSVQPAKAEDSAIILDFNGTEVTIVGFEDKVRDSGATGVFTADGVSKEMLTGSIADGGTVTLKLGQALKVRDYEEIQISMCVGSWDTAANISAYSVVDTAFVNSAGETGNCYGNKLVTLKLNASKLADANGNIEQIVLKRTGGAGQLFFDYIKAIEKEYVAPEMAEQPTETTVVDFNAVDATVVGYETKVGDSGSTTVFEVDGVSKEMWTGNIADGGTVTVQFAKAYKAEWLKEIKLRLCVGSWVSSSVVSGYSAMDVAFTNAAGSQNYGYGNKVAILTLDASKLADEYGNIQQIVLKKTGDVGQMFFDYVELVVAEKEPEVPEIPDEPEVPDTPVEPEAPEMAEEPTETLNLDFNAVDATVVGYETKVGDSGSTTVFEADGVSKEMWTGNIADGGTVTIQLGKTYKAEWFKEIKLRICVGSWVSSSVVTGYAVGDAEFANPAGSQNYGFGNKVAILTLDPSKLADAEGNFYQIVLKKTGDVGQMFFDYVEMVVADEEPEIPVEPDEPEVPDVPVEPVIPEMAEEPTETLNLDFNAVDATVVGYETKVGDSGSTTVFEADGVSKEMWTGNIADGETVTIQLGRVYKAEWLKEINLRLCVGSWVSSSVVTGYAVTDTEFVNAAGTQNYGFGNKVEILTLDPSKLADAEGNFYQIVLQKTGDIGQMFFDYIELVVEEEVVVVPPDMAEVPESTLTLDFNAVDATVVGFESKVADSGETTVFKADGYSKEMWTGDIVDGGTVTIQLGKVYKAEWFDKINLRLCVGSWNSSSVVTGYAVTDIEFANEAGSQFYGYGNKVAILTLDPSKLADEEGNFYQIVLKKTGDVGQIFFDYIELHVEEPEGPSETKRFEAGNLLPMELNPENIQDENVVWAESRTNHPNYVPYGYLENNAVFQYGGKNSMGQDALPSAEVYNNGVMDMIKAQKVVQALDVGRIKAEDYAQFEVTYYFTDWAFGKHQFYLYGSGVDSFTDENGMPSGYAYSMTIKGPSNRQKIVLEDLSRLANEDGYIEYIYIVYWGNTADTDLNTVGCFSGSQLWINEVNFLMEEDVEKPSVSTEYIQKDLSEILPIGGNFTVEMKTAEEGKTTQLASVKNTYDAVEFDFTPTYTNNFSMYFLLKATGANATYQTSGLVFWLSNDGVLVGASGNYTETLSEKFTEGAFASGVTTRVKLVALPYYLDGVQEGYYLAIYVNGGETPLVETYIKNTNATLGNYTNLVLEDKGDDYAIAFASTSSNPKSAQDLMDVTLETATGKTEFTKPRASLKLSYYQMEGQTISDLIIEGDATYNAETGYLTFNSNGTVKISYSVTNAFGTFTSNVLELTYQGEETNNGNSNSAADSSTSNKKKFGCGSSIGVGSVVVLTALGAAMVGCKKKKDEE